MKNNQNKGFTKVDVVMIILGIVTIIIAIVTIIVSVTTPEIRRCLGLDSGPCFLRKLKVYPCPPFISPGDPCISSRSKNEHNIIEY